MKTKMLFAIIANAVLLGFQGCALRVYDNGKIAVADYGDTNGHMHYKTKTCEFDFQGTRDVSTPTKAFGDSVSKGLISGGVGAVVPMH